MSIKDILIEIQEESSTNAKMEILKKYQDNILLKRVIYLAKSKRVKFGIKIIPEYIGNTNPINNLDSVLSTLNDIIDKIVTGNNAIKLLHDILVSLEPDDVYVIERIIEKDLKIGMGTTNINKIIGKNFIEKTPYQGAVAYSEDVAQDIINNDSIGAVSQIKMDGRYSNAIISSNVTLESRQGEPSYLEGAKFLEELKDFGDIDLVLNGELTMDGIEKTVELSPDDYIELDGKKIKVSDIPIKV